MALSPEQEQQITNLLSKFGAKNISILQDALKILDPDGSLQAQSQQTPSKQQAKTPAEDSSQSTASEASQSDTPPVEQPASKAAPAETQQTAAPDATTIGKMPDYSNPNTDSGNNTVSSGSEDSSTDVKDIDSSAPSGDTFNKSTPTALRRRGGSSGGLDALSDGEEAESDTTTGQPVEQEIASKQPADQDTASEQPSEQEVTDGQSTEQDVASVQEPELTPSQVARQIVNQQRERGRGHAKDYAQARIGNADTNKDEFLKQLDQEEATANKTNKPDYAKSYPQVSDYAGKKGEKRLQHDAEKLTKKIEAGKELTPKEQQRLGLISLIQSRKNNSEEVQSDDSTVSDNSNFEETDINSEEDNPIDTPKNYNTAQLGKEDNTVNRDDSKISNYISDEDNRIDQEFNKALDKQAQKDSDKSYKELEKALGADNPGALKKLSNAIKAGGGKVKDFFKGLKNRWDQNRILKNVDSGNVSADDLEKAFTAAKTNRHKFGDSKEIDGAVIEFQAALDRNDYALLESTMQLVKELKEYQLLEKDQSYAFLKNYFSQINEDYQGLINNSK